MTAAIFDVRLGHVRPAHAVYVRRRLVVAMVAAALVLVGGMVAHRVLTDRGGVPASIPAIRSASDPSGASTAADVIAAASVATAAHATYLVQGGDTLWSIAQRFHGRHGVGDYVDRLVSSNHGTSLQPGQVLTLP